MAQSLGYTRSPSETEALKLWHASELPRVLKRNTGAGPIEVTQALGLCIFVKLTSHCDTKQSLRTTLCGSCQPCHFPSSQSEANEISQIHVSLSTHFLI